MTYEKENVADSLNRNTLQNRHKQDLIYAHLVGRTPHYVLQSPNRSFTDFLKSQSARYSWIITLSEYATKAHFGRSSVSNYKQIFTLCQREINRGCWRNKIEDRKGGFEVILYEEKLISVREKKKEKKIKDKEENKNDICIIKIMKNYASL